MFSREHIIARRQERGLPSSSPRLAKQGPEHRDLNTVPLLLSTRSPHWPR